MSTQDTPIENRYPWLKVGEVRPDLPENPTDRDFAKAYATMVIVYQMQRDEIGKVLTAHDEERRETLEILRTINKQQAQGLPMPLWAKVHAAVLVAQSAGIVWLFFSMLNEQRLVELLTVRFH